ncbi:MAG: hypothetical protein PHI24_04355 [Desulfitobacteriaceae bacterium]|nr:hypothetical protein [Desulfitobacteriaceae bacterium]
MQALLKAVVIYLISTLFGIIFCQWIAGWVGIFMPQPYPYLTFALIITIIFVSGYVAACYDKHALTRKTMNHIWALRKKGIDLRVRGCNLNSEKDAEKWINEVNKWVSRIVKVTRKLSLGLAGRLESLGDVRTFPYPTNKITQEQLFELSYLHERLERLEEFLSDNNEIKRSRRFEGAT